MSLIDKLLGRSRRYDDLDASIEEHLAEKVDDLMEQGMPRREAEQAARRAFGNTALIAQRSREQWQWPATERLLGDIRLALRRMAKSPVFSATVILTLAIGIGANTAVFSVLQTILFKPLPYPNSDRLIALSLQAPGAPGLASFRNGLPLSPSMYLTFNENNRSFKSMGIWNPNKANVTGIARPEQVRVINASGGVLETLAVPPLAGRWLNAEDQVPHGRRSVVLSYGYWQRRFGGDAGAIGRTIEIDSLPWQIVGVMPRGFRMVDADFDIIRPLALDPRNEGHAGFGFSSVARLRDGTSIEQANADIARLLPVWMDAWSDGPVTNGRYYEIWKITPAFKLLKKQVIGSINSVLWLVMATIGVVMLIACTNVANMLLVRADSRRQELAVRAALGAGRGRIACELLTESVCLSVLGGLFGVAVAYGGLRLLNAIGPANLPRLSEISLSPLAMAFTVSLSIATGLFLGAVVAFKYADVGVSGALHGAARNSSAGRDRHRTRNILVIAQVAMALVLLVCAGLMIRTFAALRHVEPGFGDADDLETMRVAIPYSLIADPVAVTHIQNQIADKLAQLPGVSSAAYAAMVPMEDVEPNWNQIQVQGRDKWDAKNPLPMRLYNNTSPNYFRTMGSRLVAGREFTWDDVYNQRPYGIISENLAKELFGSAEAALGKNFTEFPPMPWHQVIGVVEDVRQNGLDAPAPAIVYWPTMMANLYGPEPLDAVRSVTFAVHSPRAGTETLRQEMQQAVWQVNGNLPVASQRTMNEIESTSIARVSFTLTMLAIAGVMSLLLGVLGIYGVISYAVSQRTREIGIRLALGAQRSELRWMFVRSALILTGIGLGIGLACAVALTRTMSSVLYGISPLDPVTYISVPLLLATCAALAAYLPARRAAFVEPVVALREQ